MQIAATQQALYPRFAAALAALIFPGDPAKFTHVQPSLAVALSGGADSMSLALLADGWARARGARLLTLTVDHRLRPESTNEAARVAAWMKARGITHHTLTPAHSGEARNLQEAARQWRYDALADFCRAQGVLHCLLAHQAGDNRETAALHQARGETADGDSGMAALRCYRGVRFLRPLLHAERHALEDFLRRMQAEWIEDPSNQNPRFARVRMRAALAENNAENVTRDAALTQAAHARNARDHALAQVAAHLVTLHPLGFASLSLDGWRALPETLATQLLADCLTTISGATHRPRAADTARLAHALRQENFHRRTLHGCELSASGDRLRIAREMARVASPLSLSGSGETIWDGRFRLRFHFTDATPLTLRALGADGKKQLATRSAAARTLPLATPSLWHLDSLLHVPHIDMNPPPGMQLTLGFAPPKPLAAAAFWCFNTP